MAETTNRLLLFNKPYGVLSQFSDQGGDSEDKTNTAATHSKTLNPSSPRQTLAEYIDAPGFYPAGRLDRDSEGLLLLTDNGKLQSHISHPRHKLIKTYYVQVEGSMTTAALVQLKQGVVLKDGPAKAVSAATTASPDWLWPRVPPIRQRKTVTDSWLILAINEGRNRQVRRMTAAVGFPTLRLIRYSVGDWNLENIPQGQWTEVAHSFQSGSMPLKTDYSKNRSRRRPNEHSRQNQRKPGPPRKR